LENGNYGKEVVIDLHSCSIENMTKDGMLEFCDELCKMIDMEKISIHIWENEGISQEEWDASPHLRGISCVQFIKTSSIVIHAIYGMKQCYLNVFSCKDYDENIVIAYARDYFCGKVVNTKTIPRV
jgi:S-adenosylmethionine/arginine decarboxylase-like enzyme